MMSDDQKPIISELGLKLFSATLEQTRQLTETTIELYKGRCERMDADNDEALELLYDALNYVPPISRSAKRIKAAISLLRKHGRSVE